MQSYLQSHILGNVISLFLKARVHTAVRFEQSKWNMKTNFTKYLLLTW
jgi:hypothetical protein